MHADPPDPILRRWFTAGGALLVALGAVVLLGRLTGIRAWVTAGGIGPPMALMTAVGFLLSGTSMMALGFGRSRPARWLAGAVVLLGAGVLAGYALAPLFDWRYFIMSPREPGAAINGWFGDRMAPNAAGGFGLLGAALWLIARGTGRNRSIALLGAVLLAVALMALSGYATGLRTAFSWWRITGMALHTATGFLIGSLAVLGWSLRRTGPDQAAVRTFPFFSVALATLGVLAVVTVVSHDEREEASRELRRTIEVKEGLERFIASAARMAASVRNYALSGESYHVGRVELHRDTMHQALAQLARDTAGDAASAARVEVLRAAAVRYAEQIDVQVAARRSGGAEAAVRAFQAEPPELAQALRDGMADLGAQQDRLLAERDVLSQRRAWQLRWTLAIGGALALGLLTTAFGLVSRAQRHLREANEVLELRVAERTRDLQFLADAMPQLVYTARPDGSIAALNRRWREYLGMATEAEALEAVPHCVHPDDLAPMTARWRTMLHEGAAAGGEVRLRRADGQYLWHLWRTYPQRDDTGRIVCWIGTATDIDAQKTAAHGLELRVAERTAALATSEERFRSVTETATDAIVIADAAGRVLTWNRGAGHIFGRDAAEMIGTPLAAVLAEGDHAVHEAEMARLRGRDTRGPGRIVELHGRRRDGGEFPLEIALTSWTTGDEAFFGAVMRDISERRAAMAALRASEQLFQRLFESAPDPVILVAADGRIIRCNAGATELFGWPAGELVGRGIEVLLPERYRGRHARHFGEFFAQPRARPMGAGLELFALRRDGSEVPVDITLSPVVTDEGVQTLAVVRDITERKRVQESLAQARDAALEASRLKSEFLASVSHEIRTPMNAIIGMTGLLAETPLSSKQRSMLRLVQGGTESLLALVNDILDLTRIEAGKLRLQPEPFELRRLVEDTLALLAPRAVAKRLVLASKLQVDDALCVLGDAGRVRQVLTNLVENAIKFTERGEVVVSVAAVGEGEPEVGVRFAVRDCGAGIAPELQRRLFQPFVQLGDDANLGGAGLGLAVSRQLVDLMGGKIGCDSAPGRGSTFWFELKLPRAQRPAPAAPVAAQVLIVDDNEDDCELLARELRRVNLPAASVPGGAEALAWLRERVSAGEAAPLLLIDWHLRGMTGMQLAAAIRADAALAFARLVLISGGPIANPATARAAGFEEILAKPVRAADVQRCLAMNGPVAAPRPDSRPPMSLPLRLVLAEDNPANQMVARLLLAKIGAHVDIAPNGEEAIEQLGRGGHDALLVDCQMPRLNGYDTTRRIRAGQAAGVDPSLPIIAVTAYAMREDRAKCLAAGMNDYVTKPLRLPELCAALERCGFGGRLRPGAVEPALPENGETPALDGRTVDMLRAMPGDRAGSLLPEIVARYLAEEAATLPVLARLVDERGATLAERAHALAGEAAAVGGFAAREAALALERAARSGDPVEIAEKLGALRRACAHLRSALAGLVVDFTP